MIKFFAKRKAKKGFTLVETIVVIALIAIIMACVVAFSGPVRLMLKNTNAKADAVTINRLIGNYIERRLSYAKNIDIYYRTNAVSGNSNLIAAGATFSSSWPIANNFRGMLVFKYEESSSPSYNSTYKIYDCLIDESPSVGRDTSWILSSINCTDPTNAMYNQTNPFIDEFYGGYEYYIAPLTQIDVNRFKKKAYMKFEIDSFNFTDDYGSQSFSADDGYGIDQNTINKFYDATLSDGIREVSAMPMEKTGTLNLTFALENVKTFGDDLADNSVRFFDHSAEAAGIKGSDIVIFYSIPKK